MRLEDNVDNRTMTKVVRNVVWAGTVVADFSATEEDRCHQHVARNGGANVRAYFVSVCILLFLLTGCDENPDSWSSVEFNKAKWARTTEEERFIFSRDLVAKRRLHGLSKQEVVSLLGPPSFDDGKATYITYVLKISSGKVFLLDIRFKVIADRLIVNDVFIRSD